MARTAAPTSLWSPGRTAEVGLHGKNGHARRQRWSSSRPPYDLEVAARASHEWKLSEPCPAATEERRGLSLGAKRLLPASESRSSTAVPCCRRRRPRPVMRGGPAPSKTSAAQRSWSHGARAPRSRGAPRGESLAGGRAHRCYVPAGGHPPPSTTWTEEAKPATTGHDEARVDGHREAVPTADVHRRVSGPGPQAGGCAPTATTLTAARAALGAVRTS